MITITYVIFIYNQEGNIPALAESLKNLKGDFRKEYIIIDDCSEDNGLEVIKKEFKSFPKTTILTNDEYYGPAYCFNKACCMASGKYIQIIDGFELPHPESTVKLLAAANSMGSSVACSLYGIIDENGNKISSSFDTGDVITIDSPIKAILEDSVPFIREAGFGGCLMSRALVDEMIIDYDKVFIHNFSLALALAKYSRFTFVKETLCYRSRFMDGRYKEKFKAYNILGAILDFMERHEEVANQYTSEIYKALWKTLWNLGKSYKIKAIPKYFLSRYITKSLTCNSLIDLYKDYMSALEE